MDGHPAAAREVLWVDVSGWDQRIRIHGSLCYVSSEAFEATEGPDRIFMGVHRLVGRKGIIVSFTLGYLPQPLATDRSQGFFLSGFKGHNRALSCLL